MKRLVTTRAFPRIHVTLIDLAGVTHRRYGGIGFALDAYPVEVECALSANNVVTTECQVAARDEMDVKNLLDRLTSVLEARFTACVRAVPPQHVGFGSKTALLLAVATACNALCGCPLAPNDLKKASGRGGTSGVGVNVFFLGGVVVDLGHPQTKHPAFAPSSAGSASYGPPVAARVPFPPQWTVHLFLPGGRRYAGGDEIAFFQENTPIPGDEARQVLAAVYHGILPAFLTQDFTLLKRALLDVHATGFKRRELEGQAEDVRQLLQILNQQDDVAAGMSSMGPLVYAIAPANVSVPAGDRAAERVAAAGVTCLGAREARNAGHERREAS